MVSSSTYTPNSREALTLSLLLNSPLLPLTNRVHSTAADRHEVHRQEWQVPDFDDAHSVQVSVLLFAGGLRADRHPLDSQEYSGF